MIGKKYITLKQRDQLSPQALAVYIRYWPVSFLSILQMIAFLDTCIKEGWWHLERNGEKTAWRVVSQSYPDFEDGETACDALWHGVSYFLAKEGDTDGTVL